MEDGNRIFSPGQCFFGANINTVAASGAVIAYDQIAVLIAADRLEQTGGLTFSLPIGGAAAILCFDHRRFLFRVNHRMQQLRFAGIGFFFHGFHGIRQIAVERCLFHFSV